MKKIYLDENIKIMYTIELTFFKTIFGVNLLKNIICGKPKTKKKEIK